MSIVLDISDASARRPISHRWLIASLFVHGLLLLLVAQFSGGTGSGIHGSGGSEDGSFGVTWIPGSDQASGDGGGVDTVVENPESSVFPGTAAAVEVEPEPEKKPLLDLTESDPTKVFNETQVAAIVVDPDSKVARPDEPTQIPNDSADVRESDAGTEDQNRSVTEGDSAKASNGTKEPSRTTGEAQPGRGTGKGASSGNGTNGIKFFGIFAKARKVVYVIDASESMKNHHAMEIARRELLQSLKGLEQTAQFQVIFFDSQPHLMNGSRNGARLIPAVPRNLVQAEQFARGIEPESGTDRYAAILLALGFHPDVVFVLTDADDPKLSPQDLFDIKKANKRRASINVVEFGIKADLSPDSFLKQLARENGGQHFYRDLTKKTN